MPCPPRIAPWVLCLWLGLPAAAVAQLIPPDRLPPPGTWESAGVEGGIPARTTICATVTQAPYNADPTGAASAVTAIQRAIDACPDGQVVYVPAGRYRLDGTLTLINTSITLRGAGRATVFAANDQHAFVRVPADCDWQIGDMIGSGISHPCTAFDKWRFIPIVNDGYDVIDGVLTFF